MYGAVLERVHCSPITCLLYFFCIYVFSLTIVSWFYVQIWRHVSSNSTLPRDRPLVPTMPGVTHCDLI
jgi:hypothetical protein